MAEVLAASLAFPSVIFTVLLALAMLYWLFVILGAIDLDFLGGGEGAVPDLDGVAKGALEGAVKGAAEGLVGASKGAAEGAAEGLDMDGDAPDGLAWIFSALRFNRAPVTVVLTLIATFGWLTSVLGIMSLSPRWPGWGLPEWMRGAAVLIAAILVAFPLTSLVVRPLGPLFLPKLASTYKDFIGRVCVISTGRVDTRFGQGILDDRGAKLILNVRCDTPGLLRIGDRALLVSWDEGQKAFSVEPMDDLLKEPRARASAGAAADALAEAESEAEVEAEHEAKARGRRQTG